VDRYQMGVVAAEMMLKRLRDPAGVPVDPIRQPVDCRRHRPVLWPGQNGIQTGGCVSSNGWQTMNLSTLHFVIMGVVVTIWRAIGVPKGLHSLFRTLSTVQRIDADDGMVHDWNDVESDWCLTGGDSQRWQLQNR